MNITELILWQSLVYVASCAIGVTFLRKAYTKRGYLHDFKPSLVDVIICFCPVINTLFALSVPFRNWRSKEEIINMKRKRKKAKILEYIFLKDRL